MAAVRGFNRAFGKLLEQIKGELHDSNEAARLFALQMRFNAIIRLDEEIVVNKLHEHKIFEPYEQYFLDNDYSFIDTVKEERFDDEADEWADVVEFLRVFWKQASDKKRNEIWAQMTEIYMFYLDSLDGKVD